MKKITPEQLKCLNTMVSKLSIDKDVKAMMVSSFSNGRATSSKDLSMQEATEMIKCLKDNDPQEAAMDRMRKKVFALAYEIGFIWGDTPEDKKMNWVKLSHFLKTKGTIKKELSAMSPDELVKTVTQFQYILQHNNSTAANKATRSLLDELHLSVK